MVIICRVRSFNLLVLILGAMFVECKQNSGNTASGNAMDLARMNMNMMGHSNCDIQPCQSVCQVLNKTSGCYYCSSSCSAGSGSGLNAQLNPPGQMSLGGMSGCDSNWMQCPISCTRKYELTGCVKCECPSPVELHTVSTSPTAKTEPSTNIKTTDSFATKIGIDVSSESPKPTISRSPVQSTLSTTSTAKPSKTTIMTSLIASTIKQHSSKTLQQNDLRTTRIMSTKLGRTLIKNLLETTTVTVYGNQTKTREQDAKYMCDKSVSDNNSMKSILLFVLSTLLVISLTLSAVFGIAWRRALRKLKKNKNELYFVHKAYRQDSRARLHSNAFDMEEPIYGCIDTIPEVPPRSPPSTPLSPTAPSTDLLLRTVSLTSDTSIKQVEDGRHDYLELI